MKHPRRWHWGALAGLVAATTLAAAAPLAAAHPGRDRAPAVAGRPAPRGGRSRAGAPGRDARPPRPRPPEHQSPESGGHRPDGSEAPEHAHVLRGVLVAISDSSVTIGRRTAPLAAGVTVWRHGQAVPLHALLPGDTVLAALSGGRVVLLSWLGKAVQQVSGTVSLLDGRRLVLAVSAGSGATVTLAAYHVPAAAPISGLLHAYAALDPGDAVALTVAADRGVSSLQVRTAPTRDTGTITALRDGSLTIAAAGIPLTFHLYGRTQLRAGGSKISRHGLAVGDLVVVTPAPHGRAAEVDVEATAAAASPTTSAGGGD
jgi:hypothetical protein